MNDRNVARSQIDVRSGGPDLLDDDDENRRGVALFFAATILMLLLPSLLWDHYCVQALPALLWLFGQPRTSRSWPRALGALGILFFLSVPLLPTAPAWSSGVGILVMSLRLWPLLALYLWLFFDRALWNNG